jgi:hypothetical protein
MKNEFVSYEIALALKELGFEEPCFGAWVNNELFITENEKPKIQSLSINQCTAPLYQQCWRWFREKYNITVYLYPYFENQYQELKGLKPDGYRYITFPYGKSRMYETYEEAELGCLVKLIEIVKNK